MTLNEARLQGVVDFLNAGAAPAAVQIYAGTRPSLGDLPRGSMLVEIALPKPAGTVQEGLLTLASSDEALIVNTGQASWARVVNGHGTLAWDCDVTDLKGNGELRLASTALYAGGFTRIVTGVLG